jgi:hypothetical protein
VCVCVWAMSWISSVAGSSDELVYFKVLDEWVAADDPNTSKADEMRRNGVNEKTIARQVAQPHSTDPYSEVIRDDAWAHELGIDANTKLEPMSQSIQNSFLHTGMQIATRAFEFRGGYLAFGTFYTGTFRERANPMKRTTLDQLHAQAARTGDQVVVLSNPLLIADLTSRRMPWLSEMVDTVRKAYPSTTMTLVIDSDYNGLLMRSISHDEIENFGQPLAFDKDEEYMVPMGAIAPWLHATMWSTPSVIDSHEHGTSLTPVMWVHLYEGHKEDSTPERDGAFNLASYLKYENVVRSNHTERMPVYFGGERSIVTLVPRFDRNEELVMDMDWITFFRQRAGHTGPAMMLSPKVVREEQLAEFELGLWAGLDIDNDRWRHTAVSVHWHQGNKRISCGLKVDLDITSRNQVPTYKSGPVIYTIEKSTSRLSQGDLVRAEDILMEVKAKAERILDFELRQTKGMPSKSTLMVEVADSLWQGYYPESMQDADTPDTTYSHWTPDVHSNQGRLYLKYLAVHENNVKAMERAPTWVSEDFLDDLKELDGLAKTCSLDAWVRDAHRAKELKGIEKLRKSVCVPRAKDFLASWDDWLQRQVAAWPSNEAQLRKQAGEDAINLVQKRNETNATEKVRAGPVFFRYSEMSRPIYSEDCTASQWQDAIARAVELESKKDEEVRLSANREARKQKEQQEKQEKKAREQERRRKEAEEATNAAARAVEEAELASKLMAIELENEAKRALRSAWAASDYGGTFEEYEVTKAREAEEDAKALERARLEALAAEQRARSDQLIQEGRLAKAAAKAAHEAARQEKARLEAEAKAGSNRASQASAVIDRAKSSQAEKKQAREAARQRDERSQGGGPPGRGRGGGGGGGASSGADAARAAIEDVPRRGTKGGRGKGR